MTLQKQNIPIVLTGGVDTKTDDKQLNGSLLTMQNAVMQKTGLIQKREGNTRLSNDILNSDRKITNGTKLAEFNNELLLIDDRNAFSYAELADAWAPKGLAPTTQVEVTNIVTNSYEQTSPDCARLNGSITYAWEDTRGGVWASTLDTHSGSKVLKETQLNANGIRPRVFGIGQYHYIFYYDTVDTAFYCRRVDTANPTGFSVQQEIANDVHASYFFYDVCQLGGARMVFAYVNTAGYLKVAIVLKTGAVGGLADGVPTPAQDTTISPTTCLTVATGPDYGTQETFLVAAYTSAGVKTTQFLNNFTKLLTTVTVDSTTTLPVRNITGISESELGTDFFHVFYERQAATAIDNYVQRTKLNLSLNTAGSIYTFQRAAGLISKAYIADDAIRLNVSYSSASNLQDTYFAVSDGSAFDYDVGWGYNWGNDWGGATELSNRAVITAKFLPDVSGGHTTRPSQLPGVWTQRNDTQGVFAASKKIRVVASNTDTYTLKGVAQVVLTHSEAAIGQAFQLGQNLHIPGGFLKIYDGEGVVEHNFHLYPEQPTITSSSGGDLTPSSTYQYIIVWEWTDAQGQIHRSATSIAKSKALSGGDSRCTLTIPTLRYTKKTAPVRSEVICSIYRTLANGTIFYKVSSDTAPLYNTTQADTISYLDTMSDATAASRPLLYTTGGVLDNLPLPSSTSIVAFKNRLFAAGLEDISQIAYSKEFVTNEGVAFAGELRLGVNSGAGGVTALSVLDDKLVIFKKNQIFILTGNGPTDTGAQNDFVSPQQVAVDVGCSQPESVVLTSKGIMFKSSKGIYLLNRSLETEYIGAAVEKFNNLTITSASSLASQNKVLFSTAEGTTLVYDTFFNIWATYSNQPTTSAISHVGEYTWMKPDGRVFKPSTQFTDANSPIRTKIETAWIQTAGIQGFQRLYKLLLLGDWLGEHNLKVSIAYDFQDFITDSFTITPSDIINGSTFGAESPFGTEDVFGGAKGVYQFEVKPRIQKCQSFKLIIEDLFPRPTDSAAFTISAITAVVGIKKGTNKLASDRTLT